MLELALCDYGMLQFKPSVLAAASIQSSYYILSRDVFTWDANMHYYTGYQKRDLEKCGQFLWSLITRDAGVKIGGDQPYSAKQKYSTPAFANISIRLEQIVAALTAPPNNSTFA